jgi:hypothetical protein
MSDFLPKAGGVKVGGLSRKAQKLQAMREKAAAAATKADTKVASGASTANVKAKNSFANTKKTTFQRKAV